MSLKCVADGIYRDTETKSLFHRVLLTGRKYPTKRKLTAVTITKARDEVAALRTRAREARLGIGLDPYATHSTIGELAKLWQAKKCPTGKCPTRTIQSFTAEKARLKRLLPFWKHYPAAEITRKQCAQYYEDRTRRNRTPYRLGRSVDAELTTLSNLIEWAIEEDKLKANPIAHRRRFNDADAVRHCTAVMPMTDEILHQHAAWLMGSDVSRALGWQLLLEALTGARTSEILACRTDAQTREQPGFHDGNAIYIRRGKGGIAQWLLFEPAPGHAPLRECFAAFLNWHQQRYPHCPHFIPGRFAKSPIEREALTRALNRSSTALGLPKITSHGLRAYFVRTLRSLGIPDPETAQRLGHTSPRQVEETYGLIEPGWFGSRVLDFLPEGFAPAWSDWLPAKSAKIVELKTYQNLITTGTTNANQRKAALGTGGSKLLQKRVKTNIRNTTLPNTKQV